MYVDVLVVAVSHPVIVLISKAIVKPKEGWNYLIGIRVLSIQALPNVPAEVWVKKLSE
jgi:hypothetical protein